MYLYFQQEDTGTVPTYKHECITESSLTDYRSFLYPPIEASPSCRMNRSFKLSVLSCVLQVQQRSIHSCRGRKDDTRKMGAWKGEQGSALCVSQVKHLARR